MQSENKVLSNKFILRVSSVQRIFIRNSTFSVGFSLLLALSLSIFSLWLSVAWLSSEVCVWATEKEEESISLSATHARVSMRYVSRSFSSLMHTNSKYLLMYWAFRFNNNHLKTSIEWALAKDDNDDKDAQPEIIDEFDLQFKDGVLSFFFLPLICYREKER